MYRTTAAYVSGGICGDIWMPHTRAGMFLNDDLAPRFARMFPKAGTTFRDVLLSLLCSEGGDFRNPSFTADTVVRIERRRHNATGYSVHVWEREISALPDCADLVDADSYTGDFIGEED